MKRSQLKRKTPLARNRSTLEVIGVFSRGKPMARKSKTGRYATRPRAPTSWFIWIKSQPCMVVLLRPFMSAFGITVAAAVTECEGPIEADHAGARGVGQKCPDRECISICTRHHRERTDFAGTFRTYKQGDMRRFLSTALSVMKRRAQFAGVEIPSC